MIGAHIHPARGEASLFTQVGGKQTDLGYRNNVVAPPYEWNRLALRVGGNKVWLLINDEPVLHSGEVHADAGKVFLEFIREGNLDDEDEAAVVFRDLTLTARRGRTRSGAHRAVRPARTGARGRERHVLVGRMIRVALAALVAFGLTLSAGPGAETTQAAPSVQDVPEPPALVATYFQSDLTGPDVFPPDVCPTGGGFGENVDEGFKLTVQGRCVEQASGAGVAVRARNIEGGDGEVGIDFEVEAGAGRAGVNLYVRIQGNTYVAGYLSLGSGQAELFKREPAGNTLIAARQGFGQVDPTNWNRLALRFVGEEAWLLVNDEPILYGRGMPNQHGGIGLQVVREGNPDDGDVVALVFRNLTVSGFQAPPDE